MDEDDFDDEWKPPTDAELKVINARRYRVIIRIVVSVFVFEVLSFIHSCVKECVQGGILLSDHCSQLSSDVTTRKKMSRRKSHQNPLLY